MSSGEINLNYTHAVLGLGEVSTTYYLKKINLLYQTLWKENAICPFLLLNAQFEKINPHLPDQYENVIPILDFYFQKLKQLGIKKLLVPNITLHETIDQMDVMEHYGIELFHPVELAIETVLAQNGEANISILGSLFTMNNQNLINRFGAKGLTAKDIDLEKQAWIDDARKRVYKGEYSDETQLTQYLGQLKETVTPVIACTELSVINQDETSIDMATLQCLHFVQSIINDFNN